MPRWFRQPGTAVTGALTAIVAGTLVVAGGVLIVGNGSVSRALHPKGSGAFHPSTANSSRGSSSGTGSDDAAISPSPAVATRGRPLPRREPLIIAHRGASGYRPESTLGAFRLAADMGADFIEGDVVITRDGVLIIRHDPELSATTDVADRPEFASRKTTKILEGSILTGWFVEDFTLEEIKRLRATTRRAPGTGTGAKNPSARGGGAGPDRGAGGASRFNVDDAVPTVDEMIGLAKSAGVSRRKSVGLYLELKHPGYYRTIGLGLESRLAEALRGAGLAGRDAPVFIESFDSESLRLMRQLVDVPLIQLLWGAGGHNAPDTTPAALRTIAQYAAGLGVQRERLRSPGVPESHPKSLGLALIRAAHQAGLEIHIYTFSDRGTRAEALGTYRSYFAAKVDGVFTDKPDLALSVRGS